MSDRTKLWLKLAGLFLLVGVIYVLLWMIQKNVLDLFKTAVNPPPAT